MSKAILIVDPQYDFFPEGALAVPNGDQIIDPINKLIEKLGVSVFTSQDWHPQETVHFESGGGIWPPHCVADTRGSEIHEDLVFEAAGAVRKGTDPQDDGGYSAFDGKDPDNKTLLELLEQEDVSELVVCGLATDYCVKATVLDAINEGFDVSLFSDGVRPVNLSPEDGIKAVADMMEAGATLLSLEDV